MAQNEIRRTITIDTNAEQTNQQLTTTEQLLTQLIDSQRELNQNVVDGAQRQEAALKKTNKSVEALRKGFNFVGGAIKALGIGLLIEAFSVLKDIVSGSQPVLDAFSTAFKSLNIAFNDLVSFIGKNSDGVVAKFKAMFSDPVGTLKSFGNAIKENLTERFNSYIATLGKLASGLKELFSGNFDAARKEFVSAAKESVDIFTGVNNTVDKVSESVGNYVKQVVSQANAMVKAENAAKLAAAQNARLVEQYDRMAEQQRQLRDDESASIETRIQANNKLGDVLEKQEKAMRTNAALVVQQAKNALALNNTVDNRVKLIEAQAQADGILAQVEGFRSEQIVNRIALEKELNERNQAAIDGTNERAKIERDFNSNLIKDDTDRLAAQRKNIELELAAETERLTAKRDLYKEGTQAYVDANNELLAAQQDLNNQLISNDKQTQDTILAEKNARVAADISNDKLAFETRLAALTEQLALINETEYASEEARTAALKANSDQRIAIEQSELQQKVDIQNQALDLAQEGIGVLKMVSEKNKAIQKALIIAENAAGIGKIIINTLAANAKAVAASPLTAGQPFVTLNTIQGAIGVAGTIAATTKALSALGGGAAGGGGGSAAALSGGGAGSSGPTFNTVGASGENQLAETIASQQGNVPVAQVVASQVTTQQALDRQVINNATFI